MKMTLLAMVQDILSDMDSDEVNSITDTIEAQQVMRIIRTTYDEIINSRKWPHLLKLKQLEGQSDTTKPTHMKIPDRVQYIKWLKYNIKDDANTDEQLKTIKYLTPEAFLDLTAGRKSSESNVLTVYDDDIDIGPLLIITDQQPQFWTTFDEEYIVFDSIDISVTGQATLTSPRSLCQVYEESIFTFADAFVPDLPEKVFPYLLSESKSVAFNSIGQAPNAKEEQRSRRQRTYLAREKRRQNKKYGLSYPNYGRPSSRTANSNNNQTDNKAVSPPDYIP